ncbi:unnamed protein product [Thlaspi arvense]|uniref:Uncharacterized protein n=1 Tax=Thlaspi arvense TaxID=13288 RepID=A0AAU9T6H4_THLAR|nr:unnamed protein product [Thlaspi arvense]
MTLTLPRNQSIGVQGRDLKLTLEDALSYVKEVERAFAHDQGKFATFCKLMIDAKRKRLGMFLYIYLRNFWFCGRREKYAEED